MGSVGKIILQRLGLGLLTIFVVSIVIFAAVNALPGDFAEAILISAQAARFSPPPMQ